MDAALAGSTNIPSFEAKSLWARRISLSDTVSAVPRDSWMAGGILVQLTGEAIRIAEASVRGLVMGWILSWFRLAAVVLGAAFPASFPIIVGLVLVPAGVLT